MSRPQIHPLLKKQTNKQKQQPKKSFAILFKETELHMNISCHMPSKLIIKFYSCQHKSVSSPFVTFQYRTLVIFKSYFKLNLSVSHTYMTCFCNFALISTSRIFITFVLLQHKNADGILLGNVVK